MTATTKTPNQAATGGPPAEGAAGRGRTGQGVGGETAYGEMLSTSRPDASTRNHSPANNHDGDSMWPVVLLVLAMIGTAAVASKTFLTESAAVAPQMARLAAAAGAAAPIGRAETRTPRTARTDTAVRLTVRTARAELRAEPSPRADVVAGLRRGQTVLAIAVADEWTEVRLPGPGGIFGWVRSSLLGHQ